MPRVLLPMFLVGALSAAPISASAQWSQYPPAPGSVPSVRLLCDTGGGTSVNCPTALNIPLSEFAQAEHVSRALRRGVALSSAIDLRAPAYGRGNRLGVGASAHHDETAVSLNYTGQRGRVDFGAGVAASGDEVLGKAGLGFSW